MRIGCFNRPWGQFTYDEALDGMRDAGFTLTGLVGQHRNEPFTGPDATPEYLNELKRRITDRGLDPVITSLRFEPNAPHDVSMESLRMQIDNTASIGIPNAMTFG